MYFGFNNIIIDTAYNKRISRDTQILQIYWIKDFIDLFGKESDGSLSLSLFFFFKRCLGFLFNSSQIALQTSDGIIQKARDMVTSTGTLNN